MRRTKSSKYKLSVQKQIALIRVLILIPVLMIALQQVSAQTKSVMLTSGGFTVVEGQMPGTPPSIQSPSGSPLTGASLNFGEVAAVNGLPRRVIIKVPIRISAAKPYKLEMEVTPVTGQSIKLSDIGFGIENIRRQPSANAKWTITATDVLITDNRLTSNPGAVKVIKGIPQFDATLAYTPPVILTGMPTVADGELGEDGNSILIDLKFVIVEQYFMPDSFNFNLSLKIVPLD